MMTPDMKIIPEDAEFGLMNWRLMSREVDDKGDAKTMVKALPIMGMGVYIRSFFKIMGEWRVDEPLLLKNVIMVEVLEMQATSGLVDPHQQQPIGREYKCINRELMTMDEAKKRFAPKGPKFMPPGLELYPGAILTQERRPMVVPPMGIIKGGKGPLAAVPDEPPSAPVEAPAIEAPSTP